MEEILGGQLAVFVLAVICGVLFRYIGLPSLVGQVGAGLLVGASGLLGSRDVEVLRMMGDLGITLLLFLVGLEMNWKELHKVGKNAVLIFLGQTVLTILLFVGLSLAGLRLDVLRAILLAIALTFSSTIVVVKMLSEKKNLNSFSGKLSLAILLLQDMLAIFLLAVLPSFSEGIHMSVLWWLGIKLIALFVVRGSAYGRKSVWSFGRSSQLPCRFKSFNYLGTFPDNK
ncbi:MAG: sodium/hydrogen exchanger [Candidatus Collierbacteria bacterium GW2011_GWB1_44_35]|uniref:Sodium/hydrogen exchanger n=1 Tax=Candidatus Collierbacteria bacterium GW2011_GWB1_44_35 TaxID=1618383 RepID=A0A0G1LGA0_9BACT|nr:MAG: sodium/hydrogen exchanger [Candidatus Collierbacteria bacterium GW2011_GWB1_44_35]